MILAMALNSLYTIVDRIWVSGLGPAALTATGFFFPVMMLMVAFAVGLGIGGGSTVSRRIGARDQQGASNASTQTIIISLIVAVFFTIILLIFAPHLFRLMAASNEAAQPSVIDMTLTYANIMFIGTVFLFFSNIGNSLLRSEGNANHAMIAISIGVILNVGLDPLFIYIFKMGIAGAAWATVISQFISCLLIAYWLFLKKQSYMSFSFKGFSFERRNLAEILRVGIPSIIMQSSMSLMMFLITIILNYLDPLKGVAVFNAGWSIVTFATLPLLGMGTAVTSVSGAAYGARQFEKFFTIHRFAAGFGLLIEILISLLVFLAAPFISFIFTWSPETKDLASDIEGFLKVIWVFFPAMAGGITSSSFFQGVGKGLHSLVITLLRTLLFAVPLAYLLGVVFKMGPNGVYLGMIAASWLSSIIAFSWVSLYIKHCLKSQNVKKNS